MNRHARIRNMLLVLDILSSHTAMAQTQMSVSLGVSLSTVRCAVRELRAGKAVHISSWRRQIGSNGAATPMFSLGDEEDEPRPPCSTSAERKRRERAKAARRVNPLFDGLLR